MKQQSQLEETNSRLASADASGKEMSEQLAADKKRLETAVEEAAQRQREAQAQLEELRDANRRLQRDHKFLAEAAKSALQTLRPPSSTSIPMR